MASPEFNSRIPRGLKGQGQLVTELAHKDRLSPVVGRLPDGGCDMGDKLALIHFGVDDVFPILWEAGKEVFHVE